MNFLAHLYLSGEDEQILIGNFIADSVKGLKVLEQYPEGIKKGIIIHREIDFFMDNHKLVKQGMGRLREKYPKFSGVIMDIFYDHFLAKNWEDYHHQNLEKYTDQTYQLISKNKKWLSGKSKNMFPYMKRDNWLLSYQSISGIESVLSKMTHRINHIVPLYKSVNELDKYYIEFEEEFIVYFQEVMGHITKKHNVRLK